MKFTVGKKITIRVTDYIIKNVKISSGAVRKLIEFHDKTGNKYVWGVTYNTDFPEEGVKYVSAKIQNIKDTEDGQIIVLTGAKDITEEKEEQLKKRRAKAASKPGETKPAVEDSTEDKNIPPTVGGDVPVDNAPPAESTEKTVPKEDLNSAEEEAVEKKGVEEKKIEDIPTEKQEEPENTEPKKVEPIKPLSWQSFGISDSKAITLNVSYIRKMFDKFNEAYFNNGLSLEGVKVSAYSSTRHSAGSVISRSPVMYRANYYLGPTEISSREDGCYQQILEFRIGEYRKRINRTEKSWCEIIIHEMIHMYQYQILRRISPEINYESRGGHGPTFTTKMKEINEIGGWDIAVTDDKLGGLEISDTEGKELQEKYYLASIRIYKRKKKYSEPRGVVLIPKDKLGIFRSSVKTVGYVIENIFEIHNADSVARIDKAEGGVPDGVQLFEKSKIDALEERGDLTPINIDEVAPEEKKGPDAFSSNYYVFIGPSGGRTAYRLALVPKSEASNFHPFDDRGRGKLYTIADSDAFKTLQPATNNLFGPFYGISKAKLAVIKQFLGDVVEMKEDVDIKDLNPKVRALYESIFNESHEDDGICEPIEDENNKLVTIDGKQYLYTMTV